MLDCCVFGVCVFVGHVLECCALGCLKDCVFEGNGFVDCVLEKRRIEGCAPDDCVLEGRDIGLV